MANESDRSCAHRVSRGRTLCMLCLHYINEPHPLAGARARGAEAHHLHLQQLRAEERRYEQWRRSGAAAVLALATLGTR